MESMNQELDVLDSKKAALGTEMCPKVETPNNFCPSRFSKVCSDLNFLQIANLETHTCQDFLKYVYIFTSFKTQQVCSEFDFHQKRKSRHN